MSKYLITGGAGFIGSNIVEELVSKGEEVRVLDNFSAGKKENIAAFLPSIELIEGDIRNFELVKKAVDSMDYVLHQAALASVPKSIEDPQSFNQVNIDGTLNLLLASRDAGVKRLVFASSSSVYGDSPSLPKSEEMGLNPKAPYPISKLACEYYCRIFPKIYGLETICLRYFNVFGPKQDPRSPYAAVIPKFISMMLERRAPTIYGDGKQSRDFTYVKNIVNANLLATQANNISGKIFNIALGERHTLNELVDSLNKILGTKIIPIYSKEREGDIKHSLADINKAEKEFGYKPSIDFSEGLKKTIENFSHKKCQ